MSIENYIIMEMEFTTNECDVNIINNELEETPIEIQRSNQIILSENVTNEEIIEIISSLNSNRKNNRNSIFFDGNEIVIGSQISTGKGITDFVQNIFEHSNQTLSYPIQYQNHEYKLSSEDLLALYINEYKNIIQKKYIIRGVNITIPQKYIKSAQQFVKACNLIEIHNVTVNETYYKKQKMNDIDYQNVNEIILKYNAYKKFKYQIERMKSIMISTNDRNHLDLLNMDINKEYTQDIMLEVCKKLTCEERTKYKLYSLDTYHIFYMSQYFLSINDFINLERGVKKALGNMEKYHYNPIPLTPSIRRFFTHMITLKLFSKKDKLFEKDELIIKRIKIHSLYYNLTLNQCKQLEEWCQLKLDKVLFDSQCDNWSKDTSIFGESILQNNHIAIVIEDEDGNKFGVYINETINHYYPWIKDKNAFVFTIQQRGIIKQMKRFPILESEYAFLLYDKTCELLFSVGCIDITVGVKQ